MDIYDKIITKETAYKFKDAYHLIFKNDVEEIEFGAFAKFDSLRTVLFEKDVTMIGERVFESCINLRSVIFNNCNVISNFAFNGCYGIDTLGFKKIGLIGSGVFTSFAVPTVDLNNINYFSSYAFSYCDFGELEVNNKELPDNMFENCHIYKIKISNLQFITPIFSRCSIKNLFLDTTDIDISALYSSRIENLYIQNNLQNASITFDKKPSGYIGNIYCYNHDTYELLKDQVSPDTKFHILNPSIDDLISEQQTIKTINDAFKDTRQFDEDYFHK